MKTGSNSPQEEDGGAVRTSRRMSTAEKRRRTEDSFTRKVELLEAWAGSSVPEDQWWPSNPTDLRRWDDPEGLGVLSWSSPNIATLGGPYADLRRRFDAAVAILSSKRPKKVLPKLAKEKAARVQAEARVTALAFQNVSLMDRIIRQNVEMDAVRADRDAAQARVAEYERAFGRIRPISVRASDDKAVDP